MNELIAEMSSDVMMSDNSCHSDNCAGNQSHKRNSDFGQSFTKKRVVDDDNELMSQPLVYNPNDCRLYDEEEEEPYREYTEMEQMIRNISNQLINFRLDMIGSVEWDEYFVDRSKETSEKGSPRKRSEKEFVFPLKTGQVIHGYFLETLVSASKRTAVYVGYKKKNPSEGQIVIKIGFEMGFHSLLNECNIYLKLKTVKSVPKLVDYLWWRTYREDYSSISWGLIVLEKCGTNLVDLMKRSSLGVIHPKDVFDIAIQMIDDIEGLHESGFIHSSLKPEHFILESEDKPYLKLISLSASKTYLKKSMNGSYEHIADQKDRKLPKGDPNFHSIGYHNGFRRSRRDDMESLGYCMLYLVKGTLPWIDPSVTDLTSSKVIRKIGQTMQTTPISDLCNGLSPSFYRYFDLISEYQFADKPNYQELRKCFEGSAQ